MKKTLILILSIVLLGISANTFAQQSPKQKGFEVLKDNFLKAQLDFFSSDYMEGRSTIDRGGRLAANYLVSLLQMNGIEPYGDINSDGTRSYFQKIALIKNTVGENNYLKVYTAKSANAEISETFSYNVDYFNASFVNKNVKAELVFAGYGMIDEEIGHNDFVKTNISGKIVVLIDGMPNAHKEYFTKDRKKALRNAKNNGLDYMEECGAIGVITIYNLDTFSKTSEIFAQNKSFYMNETPSPERHRLSFATKSNNRLVSAKVSPKIGRSLVSEEIVNQYIAKADKGTKNSPIAINGKTLELNCSVKSQNVVAYNVIGRMKGKDSSKSFVIGAHYDHFGIKDGYIWNGADDNGSGTIGVMAAAAAFAATGEKPNYDIIFAAWTGEELGLIGSQYFVDNRNEFYPETEIVCNINYDMLAREYTKDESTIKFDYEYHAARPEYRTYGENNIKEYNLKLTPIFGALTQDDYTGATDYIPFFYDANISFMAFYAGHHVDYHKISDESHKLNWNKFYDLVRLGYLNTYDIVKNYKATK